jgi:hypothetical protein
VLLRAAAERRQDRRRDDLESQPEIPERSAPPDGQREREATQAAEEGQGAIGAQEGPAR